MEIEETDISSDVMEELLYYLYHDKVDDVKKINLDLLVAADKYMVSGLLGECVQYFKSNLSDQNALDVLVTAEVTNQKDLFEAASRFVGKKNLGSLNKSSTFREMTKNNPTTASTEKINMEHCNFNTSHVAFKLAVVFLAGTVLLLLLPTLEVGLLSVDKFVFF